MNFTISRTSEMFTDEPPKPCKGAYKSQINGRSYWMINVTSLAHLVKISREYGENLIISTNTETGIPGIEVYDTYRE